MQVLKEQRDRNKEKLTRKRERTNVDGIIRQFSEIELSDRSFLSEAEDTICPKCGLVYSDSTDLWVCCDGCNQWFEFKCSSLRRGRFQIHIIFVRIVLTDNGYQTQLTSALVLLYST